MKKIEAKKKNKKHIRCVVCGRDFGSDYDDNIKAYPIYHTIKPKKLNEPCEDRFYKALLRIYLYLHEMQNSVPISRLVNDLEWLGLVLMKKDMLKWCLDRGYLYVDNLMRIEIPSEIENTCGEIFDNSNLNDPEVIERAVEMIKAALKCLTDSLKPVSPDRIPIKQFQELELGESKLYDNIDTSDVQLRSEKDGMVTARRTGANRVEVRIKSGESTRERQRLETEAENER
ncbi:MAG: hypothetical protein C4527_04515 [Candidatus Omnitrophota bacterium]|jgi:hypothetical protein|nr:MAG: hypothetical protein C4527_04515 [Candidatus Omnitrophota bacterium]